MSLVEIRDFFVSKFNSETGNRLDVPKSGLNLALTFIFIFKSNYLQKVNPEQSPYLTRLSHISVFFLISKSWTGQA